MYGFGNFIREDKEKIRKKAKVQTQHPYFLKMKTNALKAHFFFHRKPLTVVFTKKITIEKSSKQ
jgi:hypothetical protein